MPGARSRRGDALGHPPGPGSGRDTNLPRPSRLARPRIWLARRVSVASLLYNVVSGKDFVSLQIGMVGLGRMGANMARRLARGGAEVVGFDSDAGARGALAATANCGTVD